jgi:CheY-like chemotaxis protein/DNA-binding XRE family transcriptional regulator
MMIRKVLKKQDVARSKTALQARLGTTIKNCRGRLGISQEELAWRAGLRRTYVADIERGVRNITLKSVASLAKALEVSISLLLASSGGIVMGETALGREAELHELGEILIVEYNPTDVELTLRAFRKARISNPVRVIGDGAEALDYLFGSGSYAACPKLRKPHVLLLDLNLPGVCGLELLRRIKQSAKTRRIPVVVLTVSQQDRDMAECRRLGAESYIIKPVGFENFREATAELSFSWALLKPPRGPRPSRRKTS